MRLGFIATFDWVNIEAWDGMRAWETLDPCLPMLADLKADERYFFVNIIYYIFEADVY